MPEIPEHLRELYRSLSALAPQAPPSPWKEQVPIPVGGATDIAFAESSDLLLVISSAGRGVFDCLTGTRVARDSSDEFDFDTCNLLVSGIGPLASERLRTAGLHGGGLALTTSDGWSLDMLTLSWPHQSLFLSAPGNWLFGPAFGKPSQTSKIIEDSEIRAFGFSPTGHTFVFATGSDLFLFTRDL